MSEKEKTPEEWARSIIDEYDRFNVKHFTRAIEDIQHEARQKAFTEAMELADKFYKNEKPDNYCRLCAELIKEAIGYLRNKFP